MSSDAPHGGRDRETHRPDLGVGSEFVVDIVDGEEQALQIGELSWGNFKQCGCSIRHTAGQLLILLEGI